MGQGGKEELAACGPPLEKRPRGGAALGEGAGDHPPCRTRTNYDVVIGGVARQCVCVLHHRRRKPAPGPGGKGMTRDRPLSVPLRKTPMPAPALLKCLAGARTSSGRGLPRPSPLVSSYRR